MTRFQRSIARFADFPGLRALRWLPVFAAVRRGSCACAADAADARRAAGPMTAPGTWSSPPRGAIAVPATASPSPSPAAAFHRPAAAGSRARSIAPGRLRSAFRSAHPGRAAAAGSPAPAARALAAASSPATAAAAPGRPRGAERSGRSPDYAALHPGYEKRKRPAGSSDGPLRIVQYANSNQRGASTITTWRPSKRASCSTLANSATSALTLSSSLVPISWCAISRPR